MQADRYERLLDGLGADVIDRYDREESGGADSLGEYIQGGGALTFGAMCRADQIAVLRAIETNLPTRTARPNYNTGASYAIKHAVERYTGFYVSNLQAKTAMRILGYKRSADELNPVYNVTRREWAAFSELSHDLAARRHAARQRVAKREEQKAAARYFYRLSRTA